MRDFAKEKRTGKGLNIGFRPKRLHESQLNEVMSSTWRPSSCSDIVATWARNIGELGSDCGGGGVGKWRGRKESKGYPGLFLPSNYPS